MLREIRLTAIGFLAKLIAAPVHAVSLRLLMYASDWDLRHDRRAWDRIHAHLDRKRGKVPKTPATPVRKDPRP